MSKLKYQIQILNLKTKLKSFAILAVVLSFGFCVLSSGNVRAQAVLPLTVAPARQEIEVDSGEKTAVNIKFYNSGEQPVSGILRVADFLVEDKDGTPTIIDNPMFSSPKFSASQWFSLPYDRISIPAQDKILIQANISVPNNAHPGGRYIAIYFEPGLDLTKKTVTDQEAGTGVATRLAGLVYIKVRGETVEKALVSQFFGPSFLEYGPITIDTNILNRGDYHIRPRGIISLTNMFGGLVDQKKLKEENIFPDTSISFKNELGAKWMIGKYRIDLAASYGDKGQSLTSSLYIWVFPWKVVTAIILIIIIFIFLVSNFYNKFITEESHLEKELEKEKEEIEKLKQQLRKRG